MKMLILLAALSATPAFAGILQDAGGAVSDVTKHAGSVIASEFKRAGGVFSKEADDRVTAVLADSEDAIHAFGSMWDNLDEGLKAMAKHNAERYHNVNPNGQRSDCTAVVAAACAYEGSALGGGFGAAIGAGSGVALADWACSAWYP